MSIADALNWRYAAKRMNGQRVPQEKLDRILEAIRLAPSSAGLQPYKVLVIDNPELRKELSPIAHNQPQITEASHLLVFAAWDSLSQKQIDHYLEHMAAERKIDISNLEGLKNSLYKILDRPAAFNEGWMARQAYIGLGVAVVAAAEEKVDATPMEGFNADALDTLLHLKEKGLKSYAILALGYRDAEHDKLLPLKKVRLEKEEFFIHY